MRKAKEVTIYSFYGDVFTGTINEFLEDYPEVIRTHLYKPEGGIDDDGDHWRLGEEPVGVQRKKMTVEQQVNFNYAQQELLKDDISEDRRQMMESLVNNYRRTLFVMEVQDLDSDKFIPLKVT